MVTIKDIAGRLGVANSTVGRALADHPKISEETKARVRSVAAELGYIPHSAAHVMRGQRSNLIGLIVPDIENDFYATMAKAVAERCETAGFQLILSITEDSSDSELEQLRLLSSAHAAGVVIVPSPRPRFDAIKLMQRIPVVQIIRSVSGLDSDELKIADTRAIYDAASYLIQLGHSRIAYIGGSEDLSTGADRLRGFREAMSEAGITITPEMIRTGMPRAAHGRESFLSIYDHAPTAVIAGGTRISVGILAAVADRNIRIPQQLSLIGFGDPPWAQWCSGGLTTLSLPVREIAADAGSLLIRRLKEPLMLEGRKYYSAVHHAHLVIRQSTAAMS